jgi:hypothetical protein
MATSGTYVWTSNRDYIITEAFRKIGSLGDYEDIDTERLNSGARALNPMVKAMAAMGMPLWAVKTVDIPLSNWASATLRIGPNQTLSQEKPLKIFQVIRIDGTNEVPLIPLADEDYQNLTDKTSSGVPTQYYYKPLREFGDLTIWKRPDSYWLTKTLRIRYQRPFQEFNVDTDEPDFPNEWHEALIYRLATRLAANYGLPLNDRRMLKEETKEIVDETKAFDQEEGSMFIRPARR